MERSTVLVSISMRPSFANRMRPSQWWKSIANGLGHFGAAGNEGQGLFEPGLELIEERPALGLADLAARFGAFSADGLFDFVKRCDLDERFFGERRVAANGDLVEPPPQMGPAEGQDDGLRCRPAACKVLVGRIAVDLQNAAEACEMAFGHAPIRGQAHSNKRRPADRRRPRACRRGHKPRAGRASRACVPDRGRGSASRRQTVSARPSGARTGASAAEPAAPPHGRPNRRAWSDRDRRPGGYRSASADTTDSDQRIC